MRAALRIGLCMVLSTVGYVQVGVAQTSGASYVVAYIEAAPSAVDEVIDLLVTHARASRNDAGSLRYQPLQRIGRPNHFAIIETWANADAQAAHAASAHIQRFRDDLEPLLYSPYDERLHTGLHIAESEIAGNAIYALTHVDLIPTGLDEGLGYIADFVAASRNHRGAIRFDMLTQANRRNHMTLVESWMDVAAKDAHTVSNDATAFRGAVYPLAGALYDERLYRAL